MLVKSNYIKEYSLKAGDIDELSGTVENYLASKKIEQNEILKLRLGLEDALLNWQSEMGEDKTVSLDMMHRLGREMISITLIGDKCNPLKNSSELGEWADTLRSSLENVPTYDYLGNRNLVHFSVQKKPISRLLLILIFLIIGLMIGIAGTVLIPETPRTLFCENYLVPIYDAFLGLFALCGIPLIFLSVLTGILGVGNINSFNMIGKKMVWSFLIFTAIATIFAMFVGLLFFPQTLGNKGLDVQYTDFLQMIIGWIPTGLFEPFINCNAMQLVILGLVFGVALLVIDNGNNTVENFFCDFNTMLLKVMSWITVLIPLFVCITLIKSIWMSEFHLLLQAWRSWIGTTLVQFLILFAVTIPLLKKYHVSFFKLLRKVFKTFIISCGSCSCTASIPENYSCCEHQLGIDYRIFVFGIPIGTSIFKPATAVRVVFLCYFVMWSEDIPISISWLIMLFVMAIIMSIATPAIPGGTLMLCGMLFSQLGMPNAVLAQMLTTDVFFDCLCIAFNQIAVSLGLASFGSKLGLVDEEKLNA